MRDEINLKFAISQSVIEKRLNRVSKGEARRETTPKCDDVSLSKYQPKPSRWVFLFVCLFVENHLSLLGSCVFVCSYAIKKKTRFALCERVLKAIGFGREEEVPLPYVHLYLLLRDRWVSKCVDLTISFVGWDFKVAHCQNNPAQSVTRFGETTTAHIMRMFMWIFKRLKLNRFAQTQAKHLFVKYRRTMCVQQQNVVDAHHVNS